jgi:hypothetical protein
MVYDERRMLARDTKQPTDLNQPADKPEVVQQRRLEWKEVLGAKRVQRELAPRSAKVSALQSMTGSKRTSSEAE